MRGGRVTLNQTPVQTPAMTRTHGTSYISGTHARPRPHIRRAHWHSYWVGKCNDPDTRTVVLKWLPPIAVNVQNVDDLTTTVRDVGHASVTQVMH